MDSAPETELWVICQVCQQPNPVGTRFCKHCWGAIIHSDSPVLSSQEVDETTKRRLANLKRKKAIMVTVISLASLIILASAVYPGLYYCTDIVTKPPRGVNSNSNPGEWAMFRHDLGHSGTDDSSSILPRGTLKWVFSTGAPIHSSPVVADGTVYFGSRDFKFYALDATTGTKRWEYQTGGGVDSSPAIVNGTVYVGSNDGKLYALDAHSGEKLWDSKTTSPIMSSPAVANGIVYFGTYGYHIYALDAVSGKKLWDFKTEGCVKSSPMIANGIVYAGSESGFCHALHALSGRFRLRFKSYFAVFSSPAASDNTVYFSNFDGSLFAINGNARSWLWEHGIRPWWIQMYAMGLPMPAPQPQSGFLWELKLGRRANSSPVLAGNTLFVGSDDKLLAIDLQSHEKRWEFKTGGIITSSPAVVGTTVYVGSEDGHLYAVNAINGEKLWDISTGGRITSSPAIADGTVYIGSHDGNLYAVQ